MKIWSKQAFDSINRLNKAFLQAYIFEEIKPESNFRVGIIGGGPKGVYAIERLASIWQSHHHDEPLEIICFNKDEHFASGPNYRTDQPDYLLINYSLGNVNFWTDESEQLVEHRMSLLEFIDSYQETDRNVARQEDFCSRALTGIYLQHCLCQVLASLPDSINVQLVPQPIDYLDFESDKMIVSSEALKAYCFSEVILCTGHSYSFEDEMSQQLRKGNSNGSYIEHIYPITRLGETDYSGKDVLVQGMGLTFVDAVLGLTEGLGGSFDSTEDSMRYIPSGSEPSTIYPFSRSGLPMLAREAGGPEGVLLKYFTKRFVEKLLAYRRKLDFTTEIYPTIELEYRYQYVDNLLNRYGLFHSNGLGLEELEYLAKTKIPDFRPFDLDKFLLPTNTLTFDHNAILEYIKQSIAPDQFSPEIQSTQEMSSVWRGLYPSFRKLYNFGGLTGESQKVVDRIYFGRFQRVSYGPPIWNMRKIYALAEAGIIRFDIGKAPVLLIRDDTQKFSVKSDASPEPIEGEILINARIAKMENQNSQPPIYKHVQRKNGVSLYQNGDYRPGCLNLDRKGALQNRNGVTLNGTPTEGWTLDNESLSRSNNNFITPWAKKIANNYVNKTSKTNPYCPSLD